MNPQRLGKPRFRSRSALVVVGCLIIGQLTSVPALATEITCHTAFGTRTSETAAKVERLIKNYLAINLSFPQHNYLITLGVTATYLAHPELREVRESIVDDDYQRVWTAMTRTHAAHGVQADVSIDQSSKILKFFLKRVETGPLNDAIRIALYPGTLIRETGSYWPTKDSDLFVKDFNTQPEYAEARAKLGKYAGSILMYLRTPEARDFSNQMRKSASLRREGIAGTKSLEEIVEEVQTFLAEKLATDYPELARPLVDLSGDASESVRGLPAARVLINAMSGKHREYKF